MAPRMQDGHVLAQDVGALEPGECLGWRLFTECCPCLEKASSMALRRAVFIWNSLAQQLEGHDSGPIVQVNTL